MATKPKRSNRPALSLHVPEPDSRPGDEVDFSRIEIPAAGSAPRPDIAAPAEETHPLCFTLVRVLDESDRAVGPWDPRLDPDTLRRMLRDMMLVRIYDDRMYRAQRQGKTSFYMKATGEEAVAGARTQSLHPDGKTLPPHRAHGQLPAREFSPLDGYVQFFL